MKKLLTILALLVNLTAIASESTKKMDTYEDIRKKEESARKLEIENFEKESQDTYEADLKAEEAAEKKEVEREEREARNDREDKHIEVKDDAGYDKQNMDKVREQGHRAWDKLQDGFDQPNK